MSKAKPKFIIPAGVSLRPRDTESYSAGDEAALRTELTAEEIDGMIERGHLVTAPAEDATAPTARPGAAALVPASPATVASSATPEKA